METQQRRVVSSGLRRVLELAGTTGQVARAIVFGSFLSSNPEPNDVDIFLIMDDTFNLDGESGEAHLLFNQPAAQAHFGASVFWVRRLACFPSEAELVSGWALKRDGSTRGIVEILKESA